jgi:hypothetical protein
VIFQSSKVGFEFVEHGTRLQTIIMAFTQGIKYVHYA